MTAHDTSALPRERATGIRLLEKGILHGQSNARAHERGSRDASRAHCARDAAMMERSGSAVGEAQGTRDHRPRRDTTPLSRSLWA
jgi:hypothetical protein